MSDITDWLEKSFKPPDWKVLWWADFSVFWFQARTGIAKYQLHRAAWVVFCSLAISSNPPSSIGTRIVVDVFFLLLLAFNWLSPFLRLQQELADRAQQPISNAFMFSHIAFIMRVTGYVIFLAPLIKPGNRIVGGGEGFCILLSILLSQLHTWPRMPRQKKQPKAVTDECRSFWNPVLNPA
jgi:hypothetical protein